MEKIDLSKNKYHSIKQAITRGYHRLKICKMYNISSSDFDSVFGRYYKLTSRNVGISFGSKDIPYHANEMEYGGNGESKINYQILI